MAELKTIGILQPSYLPWLGYFEQIYKSDIFVFYDDVQYEKGSWRNRNRIKTQQGAQWLTVPVITKGLGPQSIKDVRIDSSSAWQKKQINALKMNYSRARYYKKYSDELFDIISQSWDLLVDLNIEIINWLCEKIDITTKTIRSSDLNIAGDRITRLIQIIKLLDGNVFYEGSAGKNYVDIAAFEAADIQVELQDYKHPVYTQLYGDFISHLSVIDLLFNCGDESMKIISTSY